MKANELRIGNWVKGPLGELCKVTQLGHEKYPEYIAAEGNGFHGQNGFEPIHLTPKILVKAGFNIPGGKCVGIVYEKVFKPGFLEYMGIELQYVHELQNIYYWHHDKNELNIEL